MILDQLRYPIVLAPMAGGPSTPALAVAVSQAGGLGFLAGGYQRTDALRGQIGEVHAGTELPFGVNLFVPGDSRVDELALASYLGTLRPEATRLGVALGEPRFDDDDWSAKVDLLHETRVPVASFTFGSPPAALVASLHEVGTEVWATATDLHEARGARDAGVDAIVLQGIEAGAHRASWVDRDDAEGLTVLALVRLVASEISLPLVAAGGIADGPALAAVLAAGAHAAQLGTAFLRAPEAGTSEAHREALASDTPTVQTRAFSGRLGRGLLNRFIREHGDQAPIAYPHIHYATAELRAEARKSGDAGSFNLWAGQTHRLARDAAAGEIVRSLAREAAAALENASARLEREPR